MYNFFFGFIILYVKWCTGDRLLIREVTIVVEPYLISGGIWRFREVFSETLDVGVRFVFIEYILMKTFVLMCWLSKYFFKLMQTYVSLYILIRTSVFRNFLFSLVDYLKISKKVMLQ